MPVPSIQRQSFIEDAEQVSEDYFGVITKIDTMNSESEVQPGGQTYEGLGELIAGALRFPGGGESIDLSSEYGQQALQRAIEYCAANGLSLEFTIQVGDFVSETQLDGQARKTGVIDPNFDSTAYTFQLQEYLFGPAAQSGATISRIKLGNEVSPGQFLYPFDAEEWPKVYARTSDLAMTMTRDALNAAEADLGLSIPNPDFVLDTPSTAMPQQRLELFVDAFEVMSDENRELIAGIDIHDGSTLKAQYSTYLGDVSDSLHFDSLVQGAENFIQTWENKFGSVDWDLHVSAWSLPGASDGGASLQNAGIAILSLHAYSQIGVSSASYFNLRAPESHSQVQPEYHQGFQQNAFWQEGGQDEGYLRAGGQVFNMMADSIVGLEALAVSDGLEAGEEEAADYVFRAFGNHTQTVVYVISRRDALLASETINVENLLESFTSYTEGTGGIGEIAYIQGERLMGESGSATAASGITLLSNEGFDLSEPMNGVEVTLGAYEIAELTVQFGIFGNGQDNEIFGKSGDDFINGRNGDDSLSGGQGADTIYGGGGEDRIHGGLGNDFIYGGSHSDIIDGGEADDQYQTASLNSNYGVVYRIYQGVLARDPDQGGFEGWVNLLNTGQKTVLEVITGFVGSQEFLDTYGSTTNSEFVTLLYNNILDRDPDLLGLSNWVNSLSVGTLTREEVVYGFTESLEFQRKSNPDYIDYMGQLRNVDDYLTGEGGEDIFVFTGDFGRDVITDFDLSASGDKIDLTGVSSINSFDDLTTEHLTQAGEYAIINDGVGNSIVLPNIDAENLTESHFLF